MKLISLFTGIGAYERALKNNAVEYDLVKFCEVDKFAIQSYCAIHDVSVGDNLGDIQAVNPSTLPDVDLITFSYPCTDLSIAGKQIGFFHDNGDVSRSGLFFSAADIIASCRPKFAISENVASLTLPKFKTEFDLVKSTLEEAGYHNYWTVLNAKDFGLPQHRERMFMVSIREDIDHGFVFPKGNGESGCIADILEPEENVAEKHYLKPSRLEKLIWYNPAKNFEGIVTAGSLETGHQRDRIYGVDGLSGTLTATDHKQPKQIDVRGRGVQQIAKLDSHRDNPNQYRVYDSEGLAPTLTTMGGGGRQPHIPINGGVRRFTPLECFRLMGFKDEDYQKCVEAGISDSQLYRQTGNSICVSVLEAIFDELSIQYPRDFV